MSGPIVGLVGRKRAGKDSIAEVLTSERGFTRVAFADPLKGFALQINPYIIVNGFFTRLRDFVEAQGWEAAKEVAEVRRLLQEIGVGQRELDADYWVRLGMATVDAVDGPVVMTDVRFPNEADAIKARGGTLVRVLRHSVNDGDAHISETSLDRYPVDRTVYNNSTLGSLRRIARVLPVP